MLASRSEGDVVLQAEVGGGQVAGDVRDRPDVRAEPDPDPAAPVADVAVEER